MGKLSEAQRKKLEELQALADAPDEYEPPDVVKMEVAGVIVDVPYRDAKRFLSKNGVDLDEVLEEEAEEGGEEEEEEEEADLEEATELQAKRRIAPKNARANKPKEEEEPAPVVTKGKSYWRKPA